jgi:hypothetical protein
MLADTEYVQPDPVGDLHFLKKIGHAVGCQMELSGRRIRKDRGKTVDTYFHAWSFQVLSGFVAGATTPVSFPSSDIHRRGGRRRLFRVGAWLGQA